MKLKTEIETAQDEAEKKRLSKQLTEHQELGKTSNGLIHMKLESPKARRQEGQKKKKMK